MELQWWSREVQGFRKLYFLIQGWCLGSRLASQVRLLVYLPVSWNFLALLGGLLRA